MPLTLAQPASGALPGDGLSETFYDGLRGGKRLSMGKILAKAGDLDKNPKLSTYSRSLLRLVR